MITEEIVSAPALVAGEWRRDGPWAHRTGPYLRRVVSRAAQASPADVARAAGYARDAAPAVARLAPAARAGVLDRAARLAAQRRDRLATLLALELGKPVKDGRGEIDRVADTLAVCAAEARRIGGELLPVAGWGRGAGTTALTYRAPAGVALAITPFNAPANLLAHKLGASFAAGNTTIVKAPPQAPASSAGVVELLLDAGMPAEAAHCCTGTAPSAPGCARRRGRGDQLHRQRGHGRRGGAGRRGQTPGARAGRQRGHHRLRGRRYRRRRPGVRTHRVQQLRPELHLGAAGLRAAGPVRRVPGRVHRGGARLRTGDPLDDATDVGSMVDDEAAERVVRWAAEAAKDGAEVVLGGTRDGATVAPTVVAHPPPAAAVVTREVFGALVAVLPYDTFGGVIETCNASRYGLQAGLFTRDIGRIITAWRELQVGGLVVNGSSNFRLDHVPFGGVKDSGFGRESPRWMIDDFTVVKTLLLRGLSVFGEEGL